MSSEIKKEQILANLALQLGKPHGHKVGNAPSDEELAAMADNRLEAVRRAQIMSYIANDAATYQRWIGVVQAVADYSQAHSSDSQVKRPTASVGIFAKLANLLFGNTLRAGMFGGGMATAAMLVAVVLLLPSFDDMTRINDVYDQWAPEISSQWDSIGHQPKVAIGATRAFKTRLEAEQIMAYGYNSGATALGLSKYRSLGIQIEADIGERPARSDTLSRAHYKALLALGRLAALTSLQCELPNINQDFTLIFKTARHLSRELLDISDRKTAALVAQFPQQVDISEKNSVCVFSDKVIASLF